MPATSRLRLPPASAFILILALLCGCTAPAPSAPAVDAVEQPDQGPAEAVAETAPSDAEVDQDFAPLSREELAQAAFAAGADAEFSGDYPGAAACYRRAAELQPAEPAFEMRLGLMLIESPETAEEGAAHLARAEAMGLRGFALYQGLASHYLRMGDRGRAAREFEKMLGCTEAVADPERFEPVMLRVAFFLSTHYQAEGRPAEAARIYGLLISKFPERSELLLERAKLFLSAGDYPAARADVAAYEKLRPASPAGARLLAVHFSKNGQTSEALTEAERAMAKLKAGGDPDDRPDDLIAMRHFRADILERLGRLDEARGELRELLAAAADDGARVDAIVALAHLERSAGRCEEAEAVVRKALGSGLTSARLYGSLAETLSASGREAEAVDCWGKARDIAPDDVYYRLALASLLERIGRRSAAAGELRALIAAHPGQAEALNMLGYLYAREGINLDEASDLVNRALAGAPRNAHYLDSLGWVRYRQGRVQEALPILERAAIGEPGAVVFEHLGDACYALGLNGRARAAWRKALEIDKDAPGPRRKLERLETGHR